DDPERLIALAHLCKIRNYPVAAARYFEKAMKLRPDFAHTIYDPAIRAALRAAAGRGEDAQKVDGTERLVYLALPHLWLGEEKVDHLELLVKRNKQDISSFTQGAGRWPSRFYSPEFAQLKVSLVQKLRRWKKDPDLAIVRDREALAKL